MLTPNPPQKKHFGMKTSPRTPFVGVGAVPRAPLLPAGAQILERVRCKVQGQRRVSRVEATWERSKRSRTRQQVGEIIKNRRMEKESLLIPHQQTSGTASASGGSSVPCSGASCAQESIRKERQKLQKKAEIAPKALLLHGPEVPSVLGVPVPPAGFGQGEEEREQRHRCRVLPPHHLSRQPKRCFGVETRAPQRPGGVKAALKMLEEEP